MRQYLIRLDDACPTINWEKWERMFSILDKYNIKPIVAVIPNNEDKSLIVDPPDNQFWKKVKDWENKGYHIAMHGYNHVYKSEKKGLVPINIRSEFAGVPIEEQTQKIRKSWSIFKQNNITPKIWVAPAHSFDKNTLIALKKETDIRIISDGLAYYPFNKYGFLWVPQQLWKPKNKKFGIWTICYHPNNITKIDLLNLENFIKKNINNFQNDINELADIYKSRYLSFFDMTLYFYFFIKLFLKKGLKLLL